MWWTIASAWACGPTEPNAVRAFPAPNAIGVPIDAKPAVVFTGAPSDQLVDLRDEDGVPVPGALETVGGPVDSPDWGVWLVRFVPAADLEKNTGYRLIVDDGSGAEELEFRTGTTHAVTAADAPTVEIRAVAAPVAADDACAWPSTTRYTLVVAPTQLDPSGMIVIRRGSGADDGQIVRVLPVSPRTEIEVRVDTDPNNSCFAAEQLSADGTPAPSAWVCAEIPPAPVAAGDDPVGKTSGGHGCASAPEGGFFLAWALLLVRRRR